MSEAINYIAMVLSVVSLVVTIVGFFASLKFYRDGVELQNKANDALTKIEEKTAFIQTQVGGMFDKTLDAAIGKREALSESFAQLSEQLERTKTKITEESVKQIGEAGEQERLRIKAVVDSQMEEIKQKVESARESAEQAAVTEYDSSLTPWERRILQAIRENKGQSTEHIRSETGLSDGTISWGLRELYKKALISIHWDDSARINEISITPSGVLALN